MNILIITQRWYPDSFGGSELVASEQARRLAERGHTVTVLTEQTPHPGPLPQGEREIVGNSPPLVGGVRGGGLIIHRYGSPAQFARLGGRSRTDVEEVDKWLRTPPISPPRQGGERRGGWDVAILHHPFAAYGFFKAGLAVPTLYVFHASTAAEVEWEGTQRSGVRCQVSGVSSFLTPLFLWWARRVERAVLRRVTGVAVFSEFSRRAVYELASEVKEKVVKLGVGVDTKRFYPSPSPQSSPIKGEEEKGNPPPLVGGVRGGGLRESKNILTVRRLTPRMGLLELVRAMKMVQEKLPSVHLTIVGEGPMRDVLQREVDRLGLQSCVTLAGRVAADKLPRYYQQADLFVLPTQAYEGLGMATLEALASGLPVVGTPVGATAEVLADLDPALVMRSASAEDIAQGILDFFARPEKERVALEKKAWELVKHKYDWEKAMDQLERVLQTL